MQMHPGIQTYRGKARLKPGATHMIISHGDGDSKDFFVPDASFASGHHSRPTLHTLSLIPTVVTTAQSITQHQPHFFLSSCAEGAPGRGKNASSSKAGEERQNVYYPYFRDEDAEAQKG